MWLHNTTPQTVIIIKIVSSEKSSFKNKKLLTTRTEEIKENLEEGKILIGEVRKHHMSYHTASRHNRCQMMMMCTRIKREQGTKNIQETN